MSSKLPEDIIVHSHHRWFATHIWQRPHHIISRLAQRHRIFYIEEPWWKAPQDHPHLSIYPHQENPVVIRPMAHRQAARLPRISERNQQAIRQLLSVYLDQQNVRKAIRWHYAPLARYLGGITEEPLTVYDCMDEHAAFKGAPPELLEVERKLLGEADLVFTGGRSIYESKRPCNERCYRFDSGVDLDHFARATSDIPLPGDVAHLPRPIIGYFGAIDERIDYPAIRAMAEAHPDWSIVLIGPVTKVDPKSLPKGPNLHWLGGRSYGDLPAYLKAFDVATILFADNEATRSLSPTKTPEYLAGRKPVVSGPVPDIVDQYSDYIWIARSPQEWVARTEEALRDHTPARADAAVRFIQQFGWDGIVDRMYQRLEEAYALRNAS
ncbi:MAG: glycosyltransferase family 1 protein [Armatimonadetes bacterium]|nr:glycosyltransferase family 1 protein [Armatimonadota bacterium]